ncbi:MAG: hypothetical protein WCO48_01655 [Candidatus Taylorbacteria bacterium]
MKKSLTFTAVVIGALLGASALSVLAQSSSWIAPTATPPSNNVAAPINVGSSPQWKMGSLGIGINPINWSALDVNGDVSIRGGGSGPTPTAVLTSEAGGKGITIKARAGNTYDLFVSTLGNVGIGNATPSAKLDVNGTVRFSGAGTPGTGKVLTSDATGNATWQTPTSPICAPNETLIPGGSTVSYISAASSYCKCFMKNSPTGLGSDLGYGEGNGNCGTNYVDSQWGCDGNGCGLTSCASRSTYWTYGYGMREQRYTNGLATCYRDWP